MWGLTQRTPGLVLEPSPVLIILGAALFLMAAVIVGSAFLQFQRASTTIDPLRPDRASVLITEGIFRYTRNPMYLGAVLVLLAWSVYLRNVGTLPLIVLFVGYLNRYQIAPEERALSKVFRNEYDAYKVSVRRWL